MWTAGIQMKWICDHRSESQFKQLRKWPEKKFFRGFNGIRTRGLCVSAAVLSQLSYEDPYTGGWPIYWVHQPVKGMKHWMKWCELREYKWNEYVTIAVNRNLSNCENGPKKSFFGASTGFEPVASALALQCSPSWAISCYKVFSFSIWLICNSTQSPTWPRHGHCFSRFEYRDGI